MLLNKQIMDINTVIGSISHYKAAPLFTYTLLYNKRIVAPLVDDIRTALDVTDEYKAYDAERIKLCEVWALKDKEGNPIAEGGHYVMSDKEGFEAALEELNEGHTEVIAEFKDGQKKAKEFMDAEATGIELVHEDLPLSDFPKEISMDEMEALDPIISAVHPPKV